MSIHKYNSKGKLVEPWEDGYFSVTTILDVRHKKRLWEWKLRVGKEESERIAKESADIGKAVHKRIEKILMGNNFKTTPKEIAWHIETYEKWFEKYQPQKCQPEVFIKSDKFGYAGTADLICEIDGEPWLIDFKTSKNTHPSMGYGIQVKAYQYAYKEMTKVDCKMAVLQLGMKTKKGYKFRPHKEPMNVFLAHKKIFDWELKHHPIKKPKVKA